MYPNNYLGSITAVMISLCRGFTVNDFISIVCFYLREDKDSKTQQLKERETPKRNTC